MSFDEKTGCIVSHNTALCIDSLKQERDQRMKAELKVKEAQAAEGAAYGAVAMVSHELRNCTQGISMTATTMMSETTSEPELRKLATTC